MHTYVSTFNNELNSLYISHQHDQEDPIISACDLWVMHSANRSLNYDMNIPISPTS